VRVLALLPLALAWTLAAPLGAVGAADGPGRYRLLSAEDAPRIERRLQAAAAEGFRLLTSAQGIDVTGKPRIAVLTERVAGEPADYRVLSCPSFDDPDTRRRLAELGAEGFGLHRHGITNRRLSDVWLPEAAYEDRLTLILERDEAGRRYVFDTLSFGDFAPFYRDLARLRSSGHEVVGMWNTGRKLQLLLQASDPARAGQPAPGEHLLLLMATRLPLAGRLESAASDGFRILAAVDPSITGPPVILLERSAVPGDIVDYKFLDDVPVRQTRDALARKLNKRARKGWRVCRRGTTDEVITLERQAAKAARIGPAEYRMLSTRRAPGLEQALQSAVDEGFEPIHLFVEPDETTVLVERVKP